MNIDYKLLDLVKRKCYQVTDNDSDENILRLKDIILDAEIKVKNMIGIDDNFYKLHKKTLFTEPGEERDLLLNYCFYAWNDKTEYFKHNYLDDILSLRSKYEIKYDRELANE